MLRSVWLAFLYSIAGIRSAWRDELAFRLEVVLASAMIPSAFYFARDKISLLLLIGSVLLVLALELVNTGIEAAIDRTGLEKDALAKKAKDTGSAAVFVALVNAGFVWAVILFF